MIDAEMMMAYHGISWHNFFFRSSNVKILRANIFLLIVVRRGSYTRQIYTSPTTLPADVAAKQNSKDKRHHTASIFVNDDDDHMIESVLYNRTN